IGSPFSTLDSQGNTTLLRRNDGLPFVEVGSTRQQVTAPWGATAGGPTETWQMLAAETLGGVNKILFRNNTNNFLHTWNLNANWNWTSSSGSDGLNTPAAFNIESAFQVDANGDGLIGSPYTTLDSQGNTTLLRRNDGLAFVEVGSTRQQVTAPWGATAGGPTETWQMLAAETLGGVNKILFRNNSANFLHTWTLDASWSWQASSGAIDPSSSQGQSLIAQFQI
ncbi:MAG: Poly(beta-D-mannuronate) epimerase 5, partial [Cyanobacteriota bacterium]